MLYRVGLGQLCPKCQSESESCQSKSREGNQRIQYFLEDKKLEEKKLDEITVQDMMLTPMGCKIVAETAIKSLATQIGKWAEEYPDERENYQADIEVLWRTLWLFNKCDFLFKDPAPKNEDLAA